MVNVAPMSEPVDPLHGLAGLSLFPKTIPVPEDPKDLESVHNFMKSMKEVKSPVKLLEEARAIVDNGSQLLNTNFTSFVLSMGINVDVAMKGKEKPQERRPGLGRKRPQFSMKLSTSQPSISVGPSLDIDQLPDPADFFSVVDKLEDAEKEIKRQKGSSILDPDMNNLPTNARLRRPGILGKSARYKHRFSSTPSENDDAFVYSQETSGNNVLGELNSHLLQESPAVNVELQEADFIESITKTENRVNAIFDELLSSNGEDLEGDRALSILQERLHIKPIELGTLCFPEFPVTGTIGTKALGDRVQKPKNSSGEIHNLLKRTAGGTPSTSRQNEESPANNLTSPTPPKSPFASLSLLKRRILQSNPLRDPFSPLNIDPSNFDLQSELQPQWSTKTSLKCRGKDVSPGGSHGETEELAGCHNMNDMVTSRNSESSLEQFVAKNSSRDSVNCRPNGSQTGLGQHDGYNDIDVRTSDCNLSGRNIDMDARTTNCHLNMDMDVGTTDMDSDDQSDGLGKAEDVLVKNNVMKDQQDLDIESSIQSRLQDLELLRQVLPSPRAQEKADDAANCSFETATEDFGSTDMDEQVENTPTKTANPAEQDCHPDDLTNVKNLNRDQSGYAAVEGYSTEVRSTVHEMSPELHSKKHPPKNKQPKAKRPACGRRERKALSYRPSLAECGTSFENGVRRSKRMKTRPLEYWKGERLLYGRVNERVKLIGLRYASPAKGSLKVESYISDDYKHLVDLAARY